jgi:hypothetical protein
MYATDPVPGHTCGVERFTIHSAPSALTLRLVRLHAAPLPGAPAVLLVVYTPFVTGTDDRLQRGSVYDRVEIQRLTGEPSRSVAGAVVYSSDHDRSWTHLFTMIEFQVPCSGIAAAQDLAEWLVAPLDGRPQT